jgi:hypothetical protein
MLFCFYFFEMSAQEGRGEIRTNDLRFIKRDPSRSSYLLRTFRNVINDNLMCVLNVYILHFFLDMVHTKEERRRFELVTFAL